MLDNTSLFLWGKKKWGQDYFVVVWCFAQLCSCFPPYFCSLSQRDVAVPFSPTPGRFSFAVPCSMRNAWLVSPAPHSKNAHLILDDPTSRGERGWHKDGKTKALDTRELW